MRERKKDQECRARRIHRLQGNMRNLHVNQSIPNCCSRDLNSVKMSAEMRMKETSDRDRILAFHELTIGTSDAIARSNLVTNQLNTPSA